MSLCCIGFFFFQAEDGIRDLVRSRGLGDVYKRQDASPEPWASSGCRDRRLCPPGRGHGQGPRGARQPVSYTHLTLPTSDLV